MKKSAEFLKNLQYIFIIYYAYVIYLYTIMYYCACINIYLDFICQNIQADFHFPILLIRDKQYIKQIFNLVFYSVKGFRNYLVLCQLCFIFVLIQVFCYNLGIQCSLFVQNKKKETTFGRVAVLNALNSREQNDLKIKFQSNLIFICMIFNYLRYKQSIVA